MKKKNIPRQPFIFHHHFLSLTPASNFYQIEVINSDGSNRRTIIDKKGINKPVALAVMERRLYYLDPVYEKVVRVDLPNGDNPKTLIDNEVALRTMVMFRKRPIPTENPCLSNQGNCDHFCIPAEGNQRKCGCSVGFQKSPGSQSGSCEKYDSFAVVSQLSLARGFSLEGTPREAMMPISGKGESRIFISLIWKFPGMEVDDWNEENVVKIRINFLKKHLLFDIEMHISLF